LHIQTNGNIRVIRDNVLVKCIERQIKDSNGHKICNTPAVYIIFLSKLGNLLPWDKPPSYKIDRCPIQHTNFSKTKAYVSIDFSI
jgi:hypothetical protein